MKRFLSLILVIIAACEGSEKYPVVPHITSVTVDFVDEDAGDFETIILNISFTDGDGDIGLDNWNPSDTLSPYHRLTVYKKTGEPIPSYLVFTGEVSVDQLIRYTDRYSPPFDTLPDPKTECFTGLDQQLIADSVYYVSNEDHVNMIVDFFYEDGNGSIVEYDFYKKFCSSFDGRFSGSQGSNGPFVLTKPGSNEWQLTFKMTSTVFSALFGDRPVRLRVAIKDRALHKSNVVETEPFFLE